MYAGFRHTENGFEALDSNHGKDPLEFRLGECQVIKAWEVALLHAHLGQKFSIICSSHYAYGEDGWYVNSYCPPL